MLAIAVAATWRSDVELVIDSVRFAGAFTKQSRKAFRICYRDRLLQGNYLVIVKGNEAELAHARLLLAHWGIKEWRVYDESERMLKA